MTALIICEKPSAAAKFAKALGGRSGSFEGQQYQIINLLGHLLELVPPEEQVPAEHAEEYAKWDMQHLPWDRHLMAFRRHVIEDTKDVFDEAAKQIRALGPADEVVIATDLDPSGEGELLAWEVLMEVGYRGPVSRMRHSDETPEPVRKAFRERDPITAESDGDLWMALARDKWDYLSMQLTRKATLLARMRGYRSLIRQGRLKSVMVAEVGRQLKAYAEYKRVPFYEVRYRDDAGNVFACKDAEEAGLRFADKDECGLDGHAPSNVIVDGIKRKRKAPPRLMDLATMSAILAKRGHDPKSVLDTYQKMYEAEYVSYPRTEDKHVTPDQFEELLPLTERIAAVVGVDASLLTHREPRKAHVKDGGAHGANRPGLKVPGSLDELDRFGKAAADIYEILAKGWLAILAEDAEFDAISAHLEGRECYVCTVNVLKASGYKQVYDADALMDVDDAEGTEFGEIAEPYIHEGANKRPPAPTLTWLTKRLERFEVGTGATRTSTLADISDGSDKALLVNDKGKLTLTEPGAISLFLLDGCRIADAEETAKLFSDMKKVGTFDMSEEELLQGFDALLEHDIRQMEANAQNLKQGSGGCVSVGKCPRCGNQVVSRGKAYSCASNKAEKQEDGTYLDTEGCGFKILPFSGRALTQKQAEGLLKGKQIQLKGITSKKTGKKYDCGLVLDASSTGGVKPVFEKNNTKRQAKPNSKGRRTR
ncbi:MAG: type IA DNA topoisomerase [Eggerthellaceae bacterium]|nr:type IA DNA topoisomerase [Eggerthellaceae bacterium]